MTSLPTNSKSSESHLQRNSMVLPLFLLILNTVFLVGLSFAVRFWIPDETHKLTMMIAIAAYFVLSEGGLVLHAWRLFHGGVLPAETAMATLISSLPADKQSAEMKGGSLGAIAEACSNEIENLRYASQLIADYSADILFSLTEELSIVEVNASAQRALNLAAINLIGAPFLQFVLSRDRALATVYFDKQKEAFEEISSPLECRMNAGPDKVIDVRFTVEWSRSKKTFYCVGVDITAEKEIQRLRAEITAMVSHDLRSPVSALSFFIEDLLSGDYGSLNVKGRLQVSRSRENVARLLRLINQLLDAEKVESGEIRPDIKIVPVSEIVLSTTQLLQSLAAAKHLSIAFAESATLVHADFDRSVQILSNLLSNAIKFSPENTAIEIREVVGKDFVRIEVCDQGPGVPPAHRDELFQRFKSWAIAGTNIPSSGLGLYLAKKLAELQAGELGFEPAEDRSGSTFYFTMRIANEDELPGYLD